MDIMILSVQFGVENAFEIDKYEIIFEYRKNTFLRFGMSLYF